MPVVDVENNFESGLIFYRLEPYAADGAILCCICCVHELLHKMLMTHYYVHFHSAFGLSKEEPTLSLETVFDTFIDHLSSFGVQGSNFLFEFSCISEFNTT